MKLQLRRGPEGAPNFCFGLYAKDGTCLTFVQVDYECAGLASRLGWVPCRKCNATDGTVDCEHRTVDAMLASAFDYLANRDNRWFDLTDLEGLTDGRADAAVG